MNTLSVKQYTKNLDLYLKYLIIKVNQKIFRTYTFNYHTTLGSGILNSIEEHIPAEQAAGGKVVHPLESLQEEIADELFGFAIPDGEVDITGYYDVAWEKQTAGEPGTGTQEEENDWSFYLIDFTGVGDKGMAGYYHYNWKENRARLTMETIVPDLFSTMMAILLRYHHSLFHLITEINLFQILNDENSPVITQAARVRKTLH